MKVIYEEDVGSWMNYEQYIESKKIKAPTCGFQVERENMNHNLFDWQKDIVFWALKKGRAALFEDCGLGKTIQQLEWAYHVSKHTKKPVLIVEWPRGRAGCG